MTTATYTLDVPATDISLFKCKHPTPILAVWTISATFAPC